MIQKENARKKNIIASKRHQKNKFDISYLNISLSSKVENEGKSILLHTFKLFIILIKYIYKIIFFNPKYIYITPTISDKGFYRDFLILELTRFLNLVFHKKNQIYLHIHMRPYNVSKFQNKYLFKLFSSLNFPDENYFDFNI